MSRNKYLIAFFICILVVQNADGQSCNANYSYSKQFQTVSFHNSSSASNAHFYWNFGDGTSTNFEEPIHEFAENGLYLVTLYIQDTINNCSGYDEKWINVFKNSTNSCSPKLNDSIFNVGGTDYIKLIDSSYNCNSYTWLYTTLGNNGSSSNTFILPSISGNWISSIKYGDTIIRRAAYKTLPWKYDRSKNYTNCSANFEFKVIHQDSNYQKFRFIAMNKNAISYEWVITGFGDPIYGYSDTVSVTYSGNVYSQYPNIPRNIYLRTVSHNGCRDSTWQSVVVRTSSITVAGIKTISLEKNEIKLFPNPFNSTLSLTWESIDFNSKNTLVLINVLGQKINQFNINQISNMIDLLNIQDGVYFVEVYKKSDLILRTKIVKQ